MDLLLDTHVIFWMMASPDELSPSTRSVLEDPSSSLWASSASAFEVSQKVRLGKWPQAAPLAWAWTERLHDYGIEDVPLTAQDMAAAGSMNWHHRDPFDRMLCAQAARRGLTLVSADEVFQEVPGLRCMTP
ncbi:MULTISPECIES: type II toxin-antitoxin system VapC family toxin [unclassified Brachybacterium]|uniref:type II toxin-antitoxin system VapC family toxin n=1 Tax=unclassified Brachybacterium TaxID=2623841 RepID=UPI0011AF3A47|nr:MULTISPECIES: type II toxin-antitoxin system VapC family toxin [unclassified Brachybacterium]